MAKIEVTPRKLILKAGSTTLTLDKDSGKATLQQKMLLWSKKPVEFGYPISTTLRLSRMWMAFQARQSITAFYTDALARSRF